MVEEEEKCRGACGGSGWEQWREAALEERSVASGEKRRCDEGSDDIKRQKGGVGGGMGGELREEDGERGDANSTGRGQPARIVAAECFMTASASLREAYESMHELVQPAAAVRHAHGVTVLGRGLCSCTVLKLEVCGVIRG